MNLQQKLFEIQDRLKILRLDKDTIVNGGKINGYGHDIPKEQIKWIDSLIISNLKAEVMITEMMK